MGKIYAQAICVLVWLGHADDSSDKAIRLLQVIGEQVEVKSWSRYIIRPSATCTEHHWGDESKMLPFKNGEISNVLELFQRPYFSRLWIKQELAFAKKAVFYCGTKTISLESFSNAVACLRIKNMMETALLDPPGVWYMNILNVYDLCKISPGNIDISDLLFINKNAQCRDPRDKIFATSTLLSWEDRLLGVQPDYTQDVETIYTEVARRVYSNRRNLNLFRSCVLSHKSLELPSWVPDWSTFTLPGEIASLWSACGFISPQLSFPDSETLSVTGIAFSQVEEVVISMDIDLCDTADGEPSYFKYSRTVELVRKIKPTIDQLTSRQMNEYQRAEFLCKNLLAHIAEENVPACEVFYKAEVHASAFQEIWRSHGDLTILAQSLSLLQQDALYHLENEWTGYDFFICANGSVGKANSGVKQGDMVTVVLGNIEPVILRQSSTGNNNKPATWKIVSVANVTDLMRGWR